MGPTLGGATSDELRSFPSLDNEWYQVIFLIDLGFQISMDMGKIFS